MCECIESQGVMEGIAIECMWLELELANARTYGMNLGMNGIEME